MNHDLHRYRILIGRWCEYCGMPFLAVPSAVRRGKGRFCDRRCRNLFRYPPGDVGLRFWEKVLKTDTCWLWIGAIDPMTGYGRFHIPGTQSKVVGAHCMAWSMTHGPIPPGIEILHHCDRRPCVRDEHLFPGTQRDNMQDMSRKGRWRNQFSVG